MREFELWLAFVQAELCPTSHREFPGSGIRAGGWGKLGSREEKQHRPGSLAVPLSAAARVNLKEPQDNRRMGQIKRKQHK